MSIETPPIQRMFDLQRRYVEKSVENLKKTLETHKESIEQTDTKTQAEIYNRALDAGKTLGDTYFDIIEENIPEELDVGQQRELYEEAYKELEKQSKQTQKAYTQNLKNLQQFYLETLDENTELLDEQIDLFLEGLDEVEGQTVEAVEQTKEVVEIEEK